jgi:hypothetical protein
MNQVESAGIERATALVVEAEPPLDNLLKLGRRTHGSVRILIGAGRDAIYVLGGRHPRDRDHWLVRGMEVPVSIDRAHPEDFEVAWVEIPSMPERAAAGDPALVDPLAARKRVGEAVIAATTAIDTSAMPTELGEAVAKAQAQSAERTDNVDQLLAEAEGETAPPGKQPAVVVISTTMVKRASQGDGTDTGPDYTYETSQGKHDAVLSVRIPGQAPYAVYVEKFKQPRRSALTLGGGIPALVSISDPADVEPLWDRAEAAGQAHLEGRIAAASEQMQQVMGGELPAQASGLDEAFSKATEDATKESPPAGMPAKAQITPEMRQMMIQNAKMALSSVPPNMRQMLIEQYRMAGIEIDDQGNIAE